MSANKIVESANVKIDEFAERNDEGNSKEPEDYEEFVYVQPRKLLKKMKIMFSYRVMKKII